MTVISDQEYIRQFTDENCKLLQRIQVLENNQTCFWLLGANQEKTWETSCGQEIVLDEGTPEENQFIYCPFCGAVIESGEEGGEL